MQAIIMAGGKGTRLRPYTNILPKPLLPLGLNSILDINIKQLSASGFDEIIISVGYLGEIIQSVIGNGDKYGVNVQYSYENKPMGTVGALSLMKDKLKRNFVVMNGDILHNVKFEKLIKKHQLQNESNVTITTYQHSYKVPLGVLDMVDDNIVDYIEKPTSNYMVSMGIYVLDKILINKYFSHGINLDFPDLIKNIIADKGLIHPFVHDGLWVDLGTPEDYIKVLDQLSEIKNNYPEIPIQL